MCELEHIKIIVVFACLAYASYKDIREGEISNYLWCVLLAFGSLFLIVDGVNILLPLFCSVTTMLILMLAFYRFQWFAGADVKAMLCLSVLYPYFTNPTSLHSFASLPSSFRFPLLPFPTFTLNILFFSLLTGALYSLLLKKKEGIVFLPHITIGWITVLIIKNFI